MAVDLRYEDVRYAVADLAGDVRRIRATPRGPDPEIVVGEIRQAITEAQADYGRRLRVVSLAIAGTVLDGRVAQAASFGWGTLDLEQVLPDRTLPLLANNDATLAGLAEVRSGAARGVGTALHLTVEVGVGGALLVAERPVSGAGGAAGEYGHLPFGDRSLLCPCGARGCWDLEVDGRALARHLGALPPSDPRGYARQVIRAAEHDPRARQAVSRVVGALASGIAGLVNLHDPDVITLGGLGDELREAAPAEFTAAYEAGLMAFRRPLPPPVRAATHGEDGALHGAAAAGLDVVLSEEGLDAWERAQRGKP
jgi:predicted NBD/HSP70 family sugar kinase